jgi:hypothetical protein
MADPMPLAPKSGLPCCDHPAGRVIACGVGRAHEISANAAQR